MNETPTHEDIIAALSEAGFAPKRDRSLVVAELSGRLGKIREFIIEPSEGLWLVTQRDTDVMKGDDEPEEEETDLGRFRTAAEVVSAMRDAQFGC